MGKGPATAQARPGAVATSVLFCSEGRSFVVDPKVDARAVAATEAGARLVGRATTPVVVEENPIHHARCLSPGQWSVARAKDPRPREAAHALKAEKGPLVGVLSAWQHAGARRNVRADSWWCLGVRWLVLARGIAATASLVAERAV